MTSAPRTVRFAARREAILTVASAQINLVGVRGMTLTAVARALGLDTSSVTYYFKRKDQLAAACLEQTLEWLRGAVIAAAAMPDPASRVRRLLAVALRLHADQRTAGAAQLALLSDLGSLDDDVRAPLAALYVEILTRVRAMFDGAPRQTLVRAVALLAIVHWLPAWIDDYLLADFPMVEDALVEAFGGGWRADATTTVAEAPPEEDELEDAQTRFLLAATELINRHGYHGASVDRIAAHLGVSTGSFYHHLDNKDDLVIACFDRTFGLIERAFDRARTLDSGGARIGAVAADLVAVQFAAPSPLLRMGAFQALPPSLRGDRLVQIRRLTRHIAGVFAIGARDGSLRAIDPQVSGHYFMAMMIAAGELRSWAGRHPRIASREYLALVDRGAFG